MGRNALGDTGLGNGGFDGSLDMRFMKVIAAHFAGIGQEGKLGGREEPLPDVFAGGIFVFLVEEPRQEDAGILFGQVLGMEAAHFLNLLANFRQGTTGQGHSSIFLAFAVVNSEQHGVEVETVNTEIDAFGQAQAATIEQQNNQAIRRVQVSQDRLNLTSGKHYWNVSMALGANDPVDFTKFPM
jgi:hypothetical protein